MRRVIPLVLLLVALPQAAHAAGRPGPATAPPPPIAAHNDVAQPLQRTQAAAVAANPNLTPCTDLPGPLCGHIQVPLDRAKPSGAKVTIFFRVFPATDPSQPK